LVIEKTVKPPCAADSTIAKKKMRFAAWIQRPELVKADLAKYRKTVSLVEREFELLGEQDAALVHAMQLARRELLSGLTALQAESDKMLMVRNALGDKILDLCELHGKLDFANLLKKKAVGSIPRDVVDVMSEVHLGYLEQAGRYVSARSEALAAAESSGKAEAPPKRGVKRGREVVTHFNVPIAVMQLSEGEEAAAAKASLNYRARLAGVHKNDEAAIEAVEEAAAAAAAAADGAEKPSNEDDKDKDSENKADDETTEPHRMSTRGAVAAEAEDGDGAGAGASECSAAAVLARFTEVEEQLRFLESTSVGEMVSDQFSAADSAAASVSVSAAAVSLAASAAAGEEACESVSESQCMAKLMELFFGESGASAAAGRASEAASSATRPATAASKKKSRAAGTTSILLTAQPLLPCPRGLPLLVSPAGVFAEHVVGLAASSADGRGEGAISFIPPCAPWTDARQVPSAAQLAAQQEGRAMLAQSLKSRIVAAEVLLSRLAKDVTNWRGVAGGFGESLGYAQGRHLDTQHYNSADVLLIRARRRGEAAGGGVAAESEGSLQRNGFLKSSTDDADFFGTKVGGKNHGGNRKSKKAKSARMVPNQRFAAKVAVVGPHDSAIDVLSSVAELEDDGNVNNDEEAVGVSPFSEEAPAPAPAPAPAAGEEAKAGEKQAAVPVKSLRSKRTL
jgi:hypothetical protein